MTCATKALERWRQQVWQGPHRGPSCPAALRCGGASGDDHWRLHRESRVYGLSEEHLLNAPDVAEDEIVPRSWLETEEMSMVIGAPRLCVARFFELLEAEYGTPEVYLNAIGPDATRRQQLQARWVSRRRWPRSIQWPRTELCAAAADGSIGEPTPAVSGSFNHPHSCRTERPPGLYLALPDDRRP